MTNIRNIAIPIKAYTCNIALNHFYSGDLDLEQVTLAKCKENSNLVTTIVDYSNLYVQNLIFYFHDLELNPMTQLDIDMCNALLTYATNAVNRSIGLKGISQKEKSLVFGFNDLDPMSLVLECNLDIVVTYSCAKYEVNSQSVQKLLSGNRDTQTDRHIDRWTDRHVCNLYLPALGGGKHSMYTYIFLRTALKIVLKQLKQLRYGAFF